MNYKKITRFILACSLSVLFLWITFRNVDTAGLWHHLQAMDMTFVLLYCFSLIVTQVARTLRWNVLIRPFARISIHELFRISGLGLLLILLLPFRLGEFARPYLLKKSSGASFSSGIGTIVLERAIDGLTITILFFICTMLVRSVYPVPHVLHIAAFVALGFFVMVMAVIFALWFWRGQSHAFLKTLGNFFLPKYTPRILQLLESFVDGLHALNGRYLMAFFFWTVLYWFVNGWGLWTAMRAFGWQLPLLSGFVVVSVLAIGLMIPSGPAHLGTYQGALSLGLGIFGISATESAAYGLVVYPLNLLFLCGFGLPFVGTGFNLKKVVQESADLAQQPTP